MSTPTLEEQERVRDELRGSQLYDDAMQRGGYRCRHCGRTAYQTTLTVDHIIPVSRGGTNDPLNLQVLCVPCNSSKGDRAEVGPNRCSWYERDLQADGGIDEAVLDLAVDIWNAVRDWHALLPARPIRIPDIAAIGALMCSAREVCGPPSASGAENVALAMQAAAATGADDGLEDVRYILEAWLTGGRVRRGRQDTGPWNRPNPAEVIQSWVGIDAIRRGRGYGC